MIYVETTDLGITAWLPFLSRLCLQLPAQEAVHFTKHVVLHTFFASTSLFRKLQQSAQEAHCLCSALSLCKCVPQITDSRNAKSAHTALYTYPGRTSLHADSRELSHYKTYKISYMETVLGQRGYCTGETCGYQSKRASSCSRG